MQSLLRSSIDLVTSHLLSEIVVSSFVQPATKLQQAVVFLGKVEGGAVAEIAEYLKSSRVSAEYQLSTCLYEYLVSGKE